MILDHPWALPDLLWKHLILFARLKTFHIRDRILNYALLSLAQRWSFIIRNTLIDVIWIAAIDSLRWDEFSLLKMKLQQSFGTFIRAAHDDLISILDSTQVWPMVFIEKVYFFDRLKNSSVTFTQTRIWDLRKVTEAVATRIINVLDSDWIEYLALSRRPTNLLLLVVEKHFFTMRSQEVLHLNRVQILTDTEANIIASDSAWLLVHLENYIMLELCQALMIEIITCEFCLIESIGHGVVV